MVVDDSFWTKIGQRDGPVWNMIVDDSFLDKNRTTRWSDIAHGSERLILDKNRTKLRYMEVEDLLLDKNRTKRRYGTAHGSGGLTFGQKSDKATVTAHGGGEHVRSGTWR